MEHPIIIQGRLYDGVSLFGSSVELRVAGSEVELVGPTPETFTRLQLNVSPRIGNAKRFVLLPSGAQIEVADHPALDGFPQERSEGLVAWLEQRTWVAGVSIAAFAGVLALLQIYALPVVAEHAARAIDIRHERKLGEHSLAFLDKQHIFRATELEESTLSEQASLFKKLTAHSEFEKFYELEFRSAPAIGPNAFALPGGIIVVTDELYGVCSPEEVAGILAHEIGHVERRHALRQLLRNSGTAALGGLIAGDVSTSTLTGMGIPLAMAQAKYSREFEAEADQFGFELLRAHDLSPELFADCLARIAAKAPVAEDETWSFMASHPPSTERISLAHAAASGAPLLPPGR